MSAKPSAKNSAGEESPASAGDADPLEELTDAIESGAGLPAATRAAAKALSAGIAVIDRSSTVLAVAAPSPAEERKLLAGGAEVESVELRVAGSSVGELRFRRREASPPAIARAVSTLLALEVERARSPEWASDEASGAFVSALLDRRVTDRGDIVARAAELGADVEGGAGVVIARAGPRSAQRGDWRGRVLTVAVRALRAASPVVLAGVREGDGPTLEGGAVEVAAIVPAADEGPLGRAASGLERELAATLGGFSIAIGWSRRAQDPVDLYRAGKEALLAANVAAAEGRALLAFEETGSYRLLLPAMSEDPEELVRFYEETVAPLAAYDEQYETELVTTVEAYLDNDGNVSPTAEQLFTHRHTIRYRLERVKELTGHDIASTEGREKLSLGLKAMRVLGISPPRGPATEPGAEAGKVPRKSED